MSLLTLENTSIRFGGLVAVNGVNLEVEAGRDPGPDRPQRRRQEHDLQPDHRHLSPDRGGHQLQG